VKAVQTFNNCVPEEFTNAHHKNHVVVKGELSQLNVMTKAAWGAFKDEVNKIRHEIARLNASSMYAQSEPGNYDGFAFGTLVRMNHRIDRGMLSKSVLRESSKHFGNVAYIDLHGKVVQ